MGQIESDSNLLERFARHRDSEAFAEIVSRYTDTIFTTAHRILRDRALAEEATQETFIRLLNHAGLVSRSLGGWLHRTATMIAIDMIRRDARRRHREAEHAVANPRSISDWEELSPVVDLALNDLPEGERTLLIDHFLLGKSQTELAQERSLSPATMCRRMQQALESLRAVLRQRGILVAVAALGAWMAAQTADAAPITLRRELGKMKLLHCARQGPREAAQRAALRYITLLGAGAMAAIVAIALIAAFWTRNAPVEPAKVQESPVPIDAPANPPVIVAP